MEPTLAHSVRLDDDGVHILDRRRFPFEHVWVRCASAADVAKAITDMVTQSSGPYFAALGAMVLSARAAAQLPADAARAALAADAALVVAARPTNNHLTKAVAFVLDALDPKDLVGSARHGAAAGDEAYRAGCRALGAHSAAVLADGRVDVLLTAADRVAMDGHVVNKVGTLGLAVAAHAFGVPYLAQVRAPDRAAPTAADIPIEHRDGDDVLHTLGVRTASARVRGHYPAFDVTPPRFVRTVVTDRGPFAPDALIHYWEGPT